MHHLICLSENETQGNAQDRGCEMAQEVALPPEVDEGPPDDGGSGEKEGGEETGPGQQLPRSKECKDECRGRPSFRTRLHTPSSDGAL